MPDFYSTKISGSANAARAREVDFRAMPLRAIVARERNGRIAALECGHKRALLAWLFVGDRMRCRGCYEDWMRSAEQLLDP